MTNPQKLLALALPAAVFLLTTVAWTGQEPASRAAPPLPVRYEELTAPEFVQAVVQAGATCVIPLGILEKHGPHLPLGTDLLDCREIALRAAAKEYSIVFPPYYFGQIFEAKHQPGTIAYGRRTILDLLQETCDELARNGIKKIILVNGHGGNEHFLKYFCQAQLESPRDYAVYLFTPPYDATAGERLKKLRKTTLDGHAGEMETSTIMAHRPDLAHVELASQESGEDLARLSGLKYAYTGIWWYAGQPNHYRGDGSAASKELGEAILAIQTDLLVEMIRSVKDDTVTLDLQRRFFEDSGKPLETKPMRKR